MNTASFVLCENRHAMPVTESIFSQELNPLDVAGMEETAMQKLAGLQAVTIYVTGLTVALIAAVNVCHMLNIKTTLMHYDRVSGGYYAQEVKL